MNGLMQWLLAPISGAAHHEIAPWAFWHARLMVLAWAILLPLGVLVARFFKIMPGQDWPAVRDNKTWWHAHRVLQYGGMALMLAGIGLAWGNARGVSQAAAWHAILGWGVLGLGLMQLASAWARGSKGGPTDVRLRGDHYDMTPGRVAFESVHKAGGYAAILLSIATIILGLHRHLPGHLGSRQRHGGQPQAARGLGNKALHGTPVAAQVRAAPRAGRTPQR
jgi:hypothetical protein